MLFINLDPGKKIGPYEKQLLLEQSFDAIYPVLSKFDGRYYPFYALSFVLKPSFFRLNEQGVYV